MSAPHTLCATITIGTTPACAEPACDEKRTCEICRCCAEHCPGHIGLRRSIGVKFVGATRPVGKPTNVEGTK
jgi:hypothetical protein